MMALQMHAKSGARDDRDQTVVRPQENRNALVALRDNEAFLRDSGV
jgi:hypothetical protein